MNATSAYAETDAWAWQRTLDCEAAPLDSLRRLVGAVNGERFEDYERGHLLITGVRTEARDGKVSVLVDGATRDLPWNCIRNVDGQVVPIHDGRGVPPHPFVDFAVLREGQ